MATTTATAISLHWYSVTDNEDFTVDDRAALVAEPDVAVPVGTAPDGLPIVLAVRRAASVVEPILRALGASNIDGVSPDVRRLVRDLDDAVQHERRTLGVFEPTGARPVYVAATPIEQLFGTTLAARLLGATSPLLMPGEGLRHAAHAAVKTSAGVSMNVEEFAALKRKLEQHSRFVVPLRDAPAMVARHPYNRALTAADVAEGRPVVWEDLRALPSTQFHTYRRVRGEDRVVQFQGKLGDQAAYARAIGEAEGVAWTVSRHDLARVVLDVARSIIPLHKDDLVHGDIKPANILIAESGAIAHDSLQLAAGAVAAVGTKGWNAPEQIMARPVTPSTDVFSLAQLLVLVLDAAVFGDERSFIVPIGGHERIRENLLPEPDVFIDPTRVALDDGAREAWRGFLRTCLQLEPRRRPIDAAAFARQLEDLLVRAPLPGRRSVTSLIGILHCPGRKKGETPRPVWLLRDAPRR